MPIGIGLELGGAIARGVVLERTGAQVKCLAAREVPCDSSKPEAATQALIQLRQALRIARPVVVGLPNSAAILATIAPLIPNLNRSLLAVQFELQQQLPFDLAEAVWHYQWLANGTPSTGRSARKETSLTASREAIVAAVKRAVLEERLACCRRAGLEVPTVSVVSVALLNAWHAQHGGTMPRPAALLHVLSDQTAEWIMMTTRAIQVMPVASPSPETFGSDLCGAWQAFAAGTASHEAGQEGHLPKTVWMVGESAAFAPLQERLTNELAIGVERFELATGSLTVDHPERFAAAVGLALQGLGLVRFPLNLLASTRAQAHDRKVRRAAALTSACFALAAIGLGVRGAMELRQRRVAVLQALERREALYQTLRPEVRALLQHQEHVERRSRQLERLVGERTLVSQWLAQVADALPDAVWLTTLECTINGIVEGVLEGRAHSFQDVTQFFERLKGVAGMTTVKPLATTVTTDPDAQKDVIVFSVQVQRPRHP